MAECGRVGMRPNAAGTDIRLTPRLLIVYCMQKDVLPGVRHDPSTDDPFHLRRIPGNRFPDCSTRPVGPLTGRNIPTERRRDMFKKILVPLDGSALSERAIEQVEKMAEGSGAEVLLLKVVPAPLAKAPEAGQIEESKAFAEVTDRATAYLEKIGKRLAAISVKSRVLVALRGTVRRDPRGRPQGGRRLHRDEHPRRDGPRADAARKHGGKGGVHDQAAGLPGQAREDPRRPRRGGRHLRRPREVDPPEPGAPGLTGSCALTLYLPLPPPLAVPFPAL